jgi:hypothetical protein
MSESGNELEQNKNKNKKHHIVAPVSIDIAK